MTACSVEEPYAADLQPPTHGLQCLHLDPAAEQQQMQLAQHLAGGRAGPQQQQLQHHQPGQQQQQPAPGGQQQHAPSSDNSSRSNSLDGTGDGQEAPRKLAILGLPWETTEDTLKLHFSRFGGVEMAEVMKDRFSGKSRGFGFVSFADPAAATRALNAEHTIDGRRCEAKIALPKTLMSAEPATQRTTRIFVARIPASVTESQFRSYFEKFGKLQDTYMPKDHSKQAYRGIGFVTFASADSVERVMACKHILHGHEVAIDRATPKGADEARGLLGGPTGPGTFVRPAAGPNQRRSFDNGANIVGPGLTPAMTFQQQQQLRNHFLSAAAAAAGGMPPATSAMDGGTTTFGGLRSLSEERDMDGMSATRLDSGELSAPAGHLSPNHGLGMGRLGGGDPELSSANGLNGFSRNAGLLPHMGMSAPLDPLALAKAHAALQSGSEHLASLTGLSGLMPPHASGLGAPPLGDFFGNQAAATAALMASSSLGGLNPPPPPGPHTSRKSLDSALHAARAKAALDNPVIANARAGPRIFIGKLSKDTSENDVKDYFSRFGYVMDVYLPKAKDNKSEHRGFGFVTFETDAAISRVMSAGSHRLKGATIAIDMAMPKEEEALMEGNGNLGSGGSGGSGSSTLTGPGFGPGFGGFPGLGGAPGGLPPPGMDMSGLGGGMGFDPAAMMARNYGILG